MTHARRKVAQKTRNVCRVSPEICKISWTDSAIQLTSAAMFARKDAADKSERAAVPRIANLPRATKVHKVKHWSITMKEYWKYHCAPVFWATCLISTGDLASVSRVTRGLTCYQYDQNFEPLTGLWIAYRTLDPSVN